jgi:hypothetical protein
MVTTSIGNVLKRQIQNLRRAAAIVPWEERILIQRHTEAAAMRKENCRGEEHNEFPRDPLGGRSSLSTHHHSSTRQLHYVKKRNNSSNRKMGKVCDPPLSRAAASAEIGDLENKSV